MTIDWTKPIETVDGQSARVLATDLDSSFPIVIAVTTASRDHETVLLLHSDGSYAKGKPPTVRNVPPACQQEAVTDADLAKARAENERLTKERDLSKELLRSCIQGNNVLRKKAQKAIAERDEARAEHRFTLGLLDKAMADAEQDMRQRAADVCDCACVEGIGDKIRAIGDEILALPLKHGKSDNG